MAEAPDLAARVVQLESQMEEMRVMHELVLRLLTASFSLQYRNLFAAQFQQVPGFIMPNGAWVYGISWRFFN